MSGLPSRSTDCCLLAPRAAVAPTTPLPLPLLMQFAVRWSVFLLGPAGCGKSAIWRTLMKAQNNAGEKTVYRPINPKAVTRNELYGFLHPQVRRAALGVSRLGMVFGTEGLPPDSKVAWA